MSREAVGEGAAPRLPLTAPWLWGLALAAFVALGGLAAWAWVRQPAHEEPDAAQERLDRAAPPISADVRLEQTFLARADGLHAVELTLVRYAPDQPIPADGQLVLELYPADGDQPAARAVLPAAGTEHNQRLRFTFPPLADSGGQRYRLALSASGDYALSYWTCSSEAYAEGSLSLGGEPLAGDLVFTTYHAYRLADVLGDVGAAVRQHVGWWPALLLLLLLPGLVGWLYLLPGGDMDLGSALGLMLAISLAFWPLFVLWSSAVGWRLGGWPLWALVGGLLALVLARIWRPASRGARLVCGADPLPELALGLILLLSVATRLLQARELLVPAWVDSVHHTLITQLIAEQGLIPAGYQPYLPVDNLHYHIGFHANAAVLCWLSGLAPYQAVLVLGQALNALTILGVYALASQWSGERWAGVGAALVAGALSYMPSYYLSWGRYTQLAGLVLLPGACLLTGWLLDGERRPRGWWALGSLMAAGLALTHYRVIVFYALYAVCRAGLAIVRQGARMAAWRRVVARCALLAAVSLLALAPWVVRWAVAVVPAVGATYGGLEASPAQDNSFPTGLLRVGWTGGLLIAAAAGAVWGAARRKGELALIPLWCGLCLVVANLHWLGLGDIWLIHNQSVVISFWVPVSVLCGWLLGEVAHWLPRGLARWSARPPWRAVVGTLLLVIVVALGAWRSWWLVDTLNRVTILATSDDLAAIAWLDEHLPADARILVNTRRWQGELRVGTDAGYWIPLLARRETTMPPVVYYQGTVGYRQGVDALARLVEEAESLDAPPVVEALRQAGITHAFVGTRGGKLEPKTLAESPSWVELYARGAARVYALQPAGP